MKNPCVKDCPRRTEECHAECEEYALYAIWCDTMRLERRKHAEEQAALVESKNRWRAPKRKKASEK